MGPDFSPLLVVWPALARGTTMTLLLTGAILLVSTPVGILVAVARDSGARAVSLPLAVLSWLFRGIPPLLVLLIVFFVPAEFGVKLPPFPSAVLAMSLYMTFYFAEVFRGGFASVPKGQYQAAAS